MGGAGRPHPGLPPAVGNGKAQAHEPAEPTDGDAGDGGRLSRRGPVGAAVAGAEMLDLDLALPLVVGHQPRLGLRLLGGENLGLGGGLALLMCLRLLLHL